MEVVLVYITAADEEEARTLGRTLVENRLAACANVIPRIHSTYRWEGQLVEDEEALLLVKTTRGLVDRLIETVREIHSYEVPAVLVLDVAAGNQAFLDWVAAEVEA
ncbi:MAG: divalent-cation tolerance protein CutA [Bacillota bacterium]